MGGRDELENFESMAYETWGRRYPGLTDYELEGILINRISSGDFSVDLTEEELAPAREREQEANRQSDEFAFSAHEKWPIWYPDLPEESYAGIIERRLRLKDFSLRLSISEKGSMYLAQKKRVKSRKANGKLGFFHPERMRKTGLPGESALSRSLSACPIRVPKNSALRGLGFLARQMSK